jgi:Erv1 / Alr family.
MATKFVMPLYKLNALNVYGSKIWYLIHLFALGYVESDHLLYHPYQAFITSIKELFPCNVCKEHLFKNSRKFKLENYLANSSSIFLWSYLLHNEVNESNKKNSPSYNFCLNHTKKQLNTLEIIPNLFFSLFTFVKYSDVENNIGYFIMLMTSIKYLIPTYSVRKTYTSAFDKYKHLDLVSLTALYWLYLIYKDVHENLDINFHSYDLIYEYFKSS